MLTLCVTTPKDRTLVRANLDIQATENHAQVNAFMLGGGGGEGRGVVSEACKSATTTAMISGFGRGVGEGCRPCFTENNNHFTYVPVSHRLCFALLCFASK